MLLADLARCKPRRILMPWRLRVPTADSRASGRRRTCFAACWVIKLLTKRHRPEYTPTSACLPTYIHTYMHACINTYVHQSYMFDACICTLRCVLVCVCMCVCVCALCKRRIRAVFGIQLILLVSARHEEKCTISSMCTHVHAIAPCAIFFTRRCVRKP